MQRFFLTIITSSVFVVTLLAVGVAQVSAAAAVPASTSPTQLMPPFGSASADPTAIVGTIIQAMLGIVGAATLFVFIWAGFRLIFSDGNEEKITKSRETLVWAVIGLALILASYSILQYTFTVLQTAGKA